MNIYDIAKLAGVSSATVSRVLNHSGRVSEASREKVQAVIEREGFIPNVFAHNLNTKKSRNIGIICPVISDPNHAYPVAELSSLLRESGFETLLIGTMSNAEPKRPYFTSLLNRNVDAIIVIGCGCTRQEKADFSYAAAHTPLFVVNGRIDVTNVYCTICDEEKAAIEAVRLLTEDGRRRILYLYDSETYSGETKLKGYRSGVKEFGNGMEPLIVQIGTATGSSLGKTIETISRMVENGLVFDAVLAADDALAIGAGKALHLAGYPPVPLIGFNNTVLSRCVTPELTSVDNRMKQQCELTVHTLLSVLDGKSPAKCISLDAHLVERETFRTAL